MANNAVNRLPVAFIGHGSPMNALEENRYTHAWRQFGRSLGKPRAILVVSAHWYIRGTKVTAMKQPRTIHDFGGFPPALFEFRYPAPGDPELADHVRELLQPLNVELDHSWGLDHGTWSVLAHVFPEADVPVVQLSIDRTQLAPFHYELGKRLGALRDEGILVIGSGNIVHNLALLRFDPQAAPPDWAVRFNDQLRDHVLRRDHQPLIHVEQFGQPARLAVPTPDHYLPLLYILGQQHGDDSVQFLVDGIELGAAGMLTVGIGLHQPLQMHTAGSQAGARS